MTNRVYYKVGKTTVCFIQPYGDKFILCYGAPRRENLGVICKDRAEAGERARMAVMKYQAKTI